MHYFFLIELFLIRLLVFEEGKYKKLIRPKVQSQLARQLKKNPSGLEIERRIQFYLRARDFSLLIVGLVIIILAIAHQQF